MTSLASKLGFYSALYLDYARIRSGAFREPSDAPLADTAPLKKQLRIHYWTPARTQGAVVNVYDVLPTLDQLNKELRLDWHITASDTLPEGRCDWLICFKAVPDRKTKQRHARTAMLICDQAEVFWSSLGDFDLQVATSSRAFASVVSRANARTFFIGETEPADYIASGFAALKTPPSRRAPIVMWHGGAYSMDALCDLKPALERLVERIRFELHILSGQNAARDERWGNLPVRFLPWSKQNLQSAAAKARLGIVPARQGARVSYIKPASRVRCLYALGVPAVGDSRVPDVMQLADRFGGPLAHGESGWSRCIEQLLDAPEELDRLALAGHAEIAKNFSTGNAAVRWVRLLGEMT